MGENFILDAGLSQSIQYSAASSRRSRMALLTGATGFLGVNLLYGLLESTSLEVKCLVRAAGESEGLSKLRHALEAHRLWRPEFASRIHPVIGNLCAPRLGLSDHEFFTLGKQLDVIYHNAAQINLVLPYRALRSANVLGTLELLRLAAIAPVQAFHHISSAAVLRPDHGETPPEIVESLSIPPVNAFTSGYVKTKWVAEQLVNEAAGNGLNVAIYRPGLITGHSHTGVCNLRDSFSLTLRACLRLAVAPELSGIIYLTPVDFVSRAIVELSNSAFSGGKAFLINNPAPARWEEIMELVRTCGYAHDSMPYAEWIRFLRTKAEEPSHQDLEPIAALMLDSPPDNKRVPVGRNTMEGLVKFPDVRCPDDSAALVRLYLSYLSSLDSR